MKYTHKFASTHPKTKKIIWTNCNIIKPTTKKDPNISQIMTDKNEKMEFLTKRLCYNYDQIT